MIGTYVVCNKQGVLYKWIPTAQNIKSAKLKLSNQRMKY